MDNDGNPADSGTRNAGERPFEADFSAGTFYTDDANKPVAVDLKALEEQNYWKDFPKPFREDLHGKSQGIKLLKENNLVGTSVTFHLFFESRPLFSGLKNPAWSLDEKQSSELERRLESIGERISDNKNKHLYDELGYRGFSIETARGTICVNPPVYTPTWEVDPSSRARDHSLELWLLNTAKPHIDASIADYLESHFTKGDRAQVACGDPPPAAPTAPIFRPSIWNDDEKTCATNWCYDYILGTPTGKGEQPGRMSGQQYEKKTLECMIAAALGDGLTLAPDKSGKDYPVYLCMWGKLDAHWYVQNRNELTIRPMDPEYLFLSKKLEAVSPSPLDSGGGFSVTLERDDWVSVDAPGKKLCGSQTSDEDEKKCDESLRERWEKTIPTWSHKCAMRPATNRDEDGQIIHDPARCASGPYGAGIYMWLNPEKVQEIARKHTMMKATSNSEQQFGHSLFSRSQWVETHPQKNSQGIVQQGASSYQGR